MTDSNLHQGEGTQGERELPLNPYQPSQTEELQELESMPSWFVKLWLCAKQMTEEPTPPVDSWSGAFGQVYRWFLLMHVCNLLPLLSLWKLCHRWRTCAVVVILGLTMLVGFSISFATIFDYVSQHVTWR